MVDESFDQDQVQDQVQDVRFGLRPSGGEWSSVSLVKTPSPSLNAPLG
jgi:hypothetical protein